MRLRARGLSHPDAARQIIQKLIDELYADAVTIPRIKRGEKTKARLHKLGRKFSLSSDESIFRI